MSATTIANMRSNSLLKNADLLRREEINTGKSDVFRRSLTHFPQAAKRRFRASRPTSRAAASYHGTAFFYHGTGLFYHGTAIFIFAATSPSSRKWSRCSGIPSRAQRSARSDSSSPGRVTRPNPSVGGNARMSAIVRSISS